MDEIHGPIVDFVPRHLPSEQKSAFLSREMQDKNDDYCKSCNPVIESTWESFY